jgi:hypothetical protein
MTATKQTELLPCPFCKREAQQTLSSGLVSCAHESCPAFLLAVTAEHWNTRAQSAEPVQGEATVKESLTVELVENRVYGGLHIKEWHNHGLSAGRHKLYTSPAKPDAELVELLSSCRGIVAREVERWNQVAARLLDKGAVESDLLKRIDAKLAELKP